MQRRQCECGERLPAHFRACPVCGSTSLIPVTEHSDRHPDVLASTDLTGFDAFVDGIMRERSAVESV